MIETVSVIGYFEPCIFTVKMLLSLRTAVSSDPSLRLTSSHSFYAPIKLLSCRLLGLQKVGELNGAQGKRGERKESW